MTNPATIREERTVVIIGWTREAFLQFLEYETMFQGAMTRTGPDEYHATRTGHGYNGHTTTIRSTYKLVPITAIEPEEAP